MAISSSCGAAHSATILVEESPCKNPIAVDTMGVSAVDCLGRSTIGGDHYSGSRLEATDDSMDIPTCLRGSFTTPMTIPDKEHETIGSCTMVCMDNVLH